MAQTVTPYLLYSDVAAALQWLGTAFDFRETLRFAEDDGRVSHAEMDAGDGQLMMGQPNREYRNPKELGGVTVMVYVGVDDVDAHCARARKAGAVIEREPADQSYGERTYAAFDPEGHQWYFGQKLREMAPEEWGAKATG